jgi:hypothetical protein
MMTKKETLSVYIGVRLSRKELQRAKKLLKSYPDRFENISHFSRCALQVFMRKLEQEYLDLLFQQQKLKSKKRVQ